GARADTGPVASAHKAIYEGRWCRACVLMTKVLSPSVVGAVAATATAETDVSPTGDALLILTLEKRLQSLMDEIVADHH
ncbi:unnamed protein product, partial [Sphacelaria rigidula]